MRKIITATVIAAIAAVGVACTAPPPPEVNGRYKAPTFDPVYVCLDADGVLHYEGTPAYDACVAANL